MISGTITRIIIRVLLAYGSSMARYEPVVEAEINAATMIAKAKSTQNRAKVYRGVKDSIFGLLPSALRPEGQMNLQKIAKAYIKNNSTVMDVSRGELPQKQIEMLGLLWFYDLANQQGIDLPNMPHSHLGDPFLESNDLMKQAQLADEFIEVRALAQHYGIPTRMLDWTFDINAAIYFAVREICPEDISNHPEKKVSIWELDKSRLAWVSDDVRFVIPRYHENPNIRAQSGILSQIVGNRKDDKLDEMNFEYAIRQMCKSAKGYHASAVRDGEPPILIRYDIPYGDVSVLQDYLNGQNMGYHQYFPGLTGVAESMKRMSGI